MVAPPQSTQEFHRKIPYFNGGKVANGLSGCTDNPHRLDPIKKSRPDDPFCPKFFRRPEVRTLVIHNQNFIEKATLQISQQFRL